MPDGRAGLDERQGVDWRGAEEEDVAGLILLELVADFLWDQDVGVFGQAEDFGLTRICSGMLRVPILGGGIVVEGLSVCIWCWLGVRMGMMNGRWRC